MILKDPWQKDAPNLSCDIQWMAWIENYKLEYPEALFIWTGSRIIGGEKESSDWDLVIYCRDVTDSYTRLESISDYQLYLSGSKDMAGKSRWLSLSDGRLNIILVEDWLDFHRWDTATELATVLELHSKPHRVQLFESLRTNGQDNEHYCGTISSAAVPF